MIENRCLSITSYITNTSVFYPILTLQLNKDHFEHVADELGMSLVQLRQDFAQVLSQNIVRDCIFAIMKKLYKMTHSTLCTI